MKDIITNIRSHAVWAVVVGLVVWFMWPKPREVVKTTTETKIVAKDEHKAVVTHRDKVTNKKKVTTVKAKDGTVTTTTETETIADKGVTDLVDVTKLKSIDKLSTREVTSNYNRFSLGILYPIPLTVFQGTNQTVFSTEGFKNSTIVGGMRIGSSPFILNVATTPQVNSFSVGFTIEF